MKRIFKILCIAIFLAPFMYGVCKITILNPAWVIGIKYPEAKRQLQTVNSPDIHPWPMIAGLLGVVMADPDHALIVTLDGCSAPIQLDDFISADELYIKNSKISDISEYWNTSARLGRAVFINCDFTSLPEDQRKLLIPWKDKIPNSYCVPYETKRKKACQAVTSAKK